MRSKAILGTAVLFLLLGLVACYQCKSGTMRCDGTRVQLCAPNHRWKTVVDCSKLKRTKLKWRCTKLNEKRCTCRPEGAVK